MVGHILRNGVTAAAILALGACQEQKTVVVEQQQSATVASAGGIPAPMPPRPQHMPSPCDPPHGSGPFEHTPKPINNVSVPKPPRVMAEKIRGCGGVRFRIGPDGVAQDVEIMADYPVGWGFGNMVHQAVVAMRWAPRDDLAWHYLQISVIPPGS